MLYLSVQRLFFILLTGAALGLANCSSDNSNSDDGSSNSSFSSSSSLNALSSSEASSSSVAAIPSSSSTLPSSSSLTSSSSSIVVPSSSSVELSSSSVMFSSSSVALSSSSSEFSSSSTVPSSSSLISSSSFSHVIVSGTFTDARDGKVYKWVEIGEQTWMAENLDYNAGTGSWCYSCNIYGRHYTWATAMGFDASCNSTSCESQITSSHKGICPEGYHIPTNAEWNKLSSYVNTVTGTSNLAARYLKAAKFESELISCDSCDWPDCGPADSGNTYICEDAFGFSAMPGRYYNGSHLSLEIGYGYWWTASESFPSIYPNYAYNRYMRYSFDEIRQDGYAKTNGFSIRCVKD